MKWEFFAFSWALAIELGMSSLGMAKSPMRIVVSLLALAVMCFPKRTVLLGALSAAFIVHIWLDDYGHYFVHHWVTVAGCAAILVGLLSGGLERLGPVAPVIATIFLLAAGFAKLNAGFVDPDLSCGALYFAWQREYLPFSLLPDAPRAAIAFTFVSELGAAVLLWPRATRKVGLVLLAGFLMAIGTNTVGRLYEFAALFLALYIPLFEWRPVRVPWWARIPLACGVVLAMTQDANPDLRHVINRVIYPVFVLVYLGLGLASPLAVHTRLFRPAWAVAVVALLHEMLPYAGLRTERNLTMAGNFIANTEVSHHLVVREIPDLGFNRLARVVSSDSKEVRRGAVMPIIALRDYVARNPRANIRYRIDGEERGDGEANWLIGLLHISRTSVRPNPPACGHDPPPSTRRVKGSATGD